MQIEKREIKNNQKSIENATFRICSSIKMSFLLLLPLYSKYFHCMMHYWRISHPPLPLAMFKIGSLSPLSFCVVLQLVLCSFIVFIWIHIFASFYCILSSFDECFKFIFSLYYFIFLEILLCIILSHILFYYIPCR